MSDHHQWGDDTLPDDIEDDEMRDDPERIWLEPWDETGHRIWDDDPTTWGDAGVEYVRADLYEAERSRANAWAVQAVEAQEQVDDAARQIAELERRLAEAERDSEKLIAERDHREEQIERIYAALGGEGEWCSHCPPQPPPKSGDLGLDAEALATEAVARLAEAEERAAEARRKALLAATDLTNSRKRLMYTEEERLELAQRAWETLMALRRELEVDRG